MLIKGQRALAYTARVAYIEEIKGADNIELARVNAWPVIVKKNEFKEGDLAVFFEIDSKLPEEDERYAFLAAKHFKIKTMKLGKFGVFSQGLLMPLKDFPEIREDIGEYEDVTELLGVKYSVEEDNKRKAGKVDPNAKYMSMKARHPKFFKNPIIKKLMKHKWFRKFVYVFLGKKKDNPQRFPTHFPYVKISDEERVENMPFILKDKRKLIATEKLDGTSSTYILERKGRKFEFYVVSRHVRQFSPDQACYHDKNIYWDMANKYNIEQHLKDYLIANPKLTYVAIQGESVGSVQGNPLKLKEDDFYGFNFIRSDVGRISSIKGKEILESWGMKWVPILSTEWVNPDDMETMKELATGKSAVNPEVLREGIVYRCEEDNTLSFKNVSREFLLKKKE